MAIDENTSADPTTGTCTSTSYEATPWWSADLHESVMVTNIVITNRNDTYASRLTDYRVYVGNNPMFSMNPSCKND